MSSAIDLSDIDDYTPEDFAEIDEDDNELEVEEVFAFTSKLRVPKVIYTTIPVEYPDTSPEGVATVYNVTGWKNPSDVFSDIQYSINGSGGIIQIKDCPFFGGISVKKDQRTCQGIKFCEFTDQELINQEHCSVDFDSEIFQLYMQKTDENTKEAKTYTFFLATKESSCPFKRNNIPCDGGPRIGRITDYQTNVISYFIGCNKYQKNERWHRFIKVKPDEIDISLLQNLFAGFIPEQIKTSQCSMIVPKSCKRKKCDVVHVNNGNIDRGRIINKPCPVRFIKFIPNNITECPFIALVCIGIHNHPPPSPERTSSGVKNNLQSLIEQAIHEDDTITPRSLLSGNLIKAYFNKKTLAEVHVSLNNIDKLRYLMGKAYKTLHPFGQGIMGVYHNVSNTSSDLVHYVRKIDLFTNDNQVIITCILTEQAKKLITLEWFQIDVSFKRVKGEINEFEINTYDSDHHLILSLCRVFTNIFTAEGYHRLFSSLFKIIHEVSGQPIRFQHIHQQGVGCILADLDAAQAKGLGLALHDLDHEKDWQTHLTFVFKSCLIHFERNLRNKPFDKSTKNLIRQIPNMSSKEQVYDLLQQIRDTKDEGIEDWLSYYQQLHVIASLNQYISKINPEIWRKSGTNTNNAEAAHAMVNKEGKQLSLLLAISRGKRYDERCYKTIEIHDKTGVPYTHQDKSEVKRIQRSIKRKESHTRNNNLDTNDKLPSKKRKLSSSTSKTKSKKRQEDSASENEETALPKTNNNELLKLDIEERKMTLREREIKVRAAEAEARLMEAKAEALELENQKKKYDNA